MVLPVNQKKKILIVYHSQSGSTRNLANAVYDGVTLEEYVECRKVQAMEAGMADLLWCDAVIFGTPENLGYISGGLKDFFDRTFYPAESYKLNKPYGLFISAGNDGSGAVRQLQRIVSGYPLKKVIDPVIIKGEVNSRALEQCSELGQTIAAGLTMGIF